MAALPTLLVRGSLRGVPAERRNEVPVEYIAGWVAARMRLPPPLGLRDRVLVVRSETGSGKSTALPARLFGLLHRGRGAYAGPSVLCTQPRVLTAATLARDLAAEPAYPDLSMGGPEAARLGKGQARSVGFRTGPLSEGAARGLVFATIGVLLEQLRWKADDAIMNAYRIIVIDEAHERSLETDLTLLLLKAFLLRNLGDPRLPFLLLASATIEPQRYARFFGVPGEGDDRNVVEVVGRGYPIAEHYLAAPAPDYVAAAAQLVARLHAENPADLPGRGDILVFLPGAAEIRALEEELTAAFVETEQEGSDESDAGPTGAAGVLLLRLDREIVQRQGLTFRLLQERPDRLRLPDGRVPRRRVILSTVVAETGLTLASLKYVVDSGWYRGSEVYLPQGYGGLLTRPAAGDRVLQRRGRVGRKFPGEFHALYDRAAREALPPHQLPDLVTEGAGSLLLALAAEGPLDVRRIDALDPPPVPVLAAALEEGLVCGGLEPDFRLGPAGEAALACGCSAEEMRFFFACAAHRVALPDAVTVVALLRHAGDRGVRGLLPPAARELPAAALAAGAPPVLRGALEAAGQPAGPAELAGALCRLLADELLAAACCFDGFAAWLGARADPVPRLGAAAAWCHEHGLSSKNMFALVAERAALQQSLLGGGVNPFLHDQYPLRGASSMDDLQVRVRLLKWSLLEGYRLRLLRRGPGRDHLLTRFGETVEAARRFACPRPGAASVHLPLPRCALGLPRVALRPVPPPRQGAAPLAWSLQAPFLSALDGYAGVEDLLSHRRPAWAPGGEALQKSPGLATPEGQLDLYHSVMDLASPDTVPGEGAAPRDKPAP